MKKIAVMFSCFVLSFCLLGMKAAASGNVDPVIVVSLGDSYSSGEGIEPFFGQEKEWEEKKSDKDWLAHRSMLSWPSQLVIPGIEGKMADYRSTDLTGDSPCKWYFVASSGAVAQDITSQQQRKMTRTYAGWLCWKVAHVSMPRQITVFDSIEGDVDYVTMTIGGNDVDFAKIITTCVTKSTYLGSKTLEKKLEELWDNFAYFLERIIPVIEKNHVTVSLHPSDPPCAESICGVPQLIRSTSDYKKVYTLTNSPYLKISFCCGCWLEGGKQFGSLLDDLEWGLKGDRISMVHLRNITGPLPEFTETFLDNGYFDMYEIFRILRKYRYESYINPDHHPMMVDGEKRRSPQAYAFGYMRALASCADREFEA